MKILIMGMLIVLALSSSKRPDAQKFDGNRFYMNPRSDNNLIGWKMVDVLAANNGFKCKWETSTKDGSLILSTIDPWEGKSSIFRQYKFSKDSIVMIVRVVSRDTSVLDLVAQYNTIIYDSVLLEGRGWFIKNPSPGIAVTKGRVLLSDKTKRPERFYLIEYFKNRENEKSIVSK